jgi:hypothetical protein
MTGSSNPELKLAVEQGCGFAEAHMLRIMVVSEGERVPAIQPAGSRLTSFSCAPHSNHFIPLDFASQNSLSKHSCQKTIAHKAYHSSLGYVLGDQVGNCGLSRADVEGHYTLYDLLVRCRPTRVLAQVFGP